MFSLRVLSVSHCRVATQHVFFFFPFPEFQLSPTYDSEYPNGISRNNGVSYRGYGESFFQKAIYLAPLDQIVRFSVILIVLFKRCINEDSKRR
jgi:hypothetical protein